MSENIDKGQFVWFVNFMKDPLKSDEPPKPGDAPPRPGKPALFKDRRAHRIELRQKIAVFKEEINELKAIETDDEEKQTAIQKRLSTLKIRLKECQMEKDAIENFNHTQFVKNVEKSREAESRFEEEDDRNTRFFRNLAKNTDSESDIASSRWDVGEDEETEAESPDASLSPEQETKPEDSSMGTEAEPSEASSEEEKTEEPEEPETPLPQIEIPPNTIV